MSAKYHVNVSKLAGWANITGGVCVALAYILHPHHSAPEVIASSFWIGVHVLFMFSLISGIFALFGFLSAYLQRGGGASGLLGFVFSVVSLVMIFGLDYAEVFIFPVLAQEFPEVVTKYGDGTMMPSVAFAFPVSGAMFVVGYILLSTQLKKMRVIGNGAANSLIVGTLTFAVGLSGFFPMLVVQIGASLFGLGLILSGYSLVIRSSHNIESRTASV